MSELVAAVFRRVSAASTLAWAAVSAGLAMGLWAAVTLFPSAFMPVVALALGLSLVLLVSARPEYGLVALTGAAALDVAGRVASVGGVPITLYQLTAAVVVAVVGWSVVTGRTRLRRTGADLPVILFLGAGVASLPSASDHLLGGVTLLSLASSVALLYLTVQLVDDERRFAVVVWGIAILAAVFGLLAVIERLGIFSIQPFLKTWADGIRARATFKDPNVFASFLAFGAAFAVPLALAQRKMLGKLAGWTAAALATAGLAATLSRGAWIGFAAAMAVVLIASRASVWSKTVLASTAGIGGVALLLRVLDPEWVQTKIVGFADNASFLYRIWMGRSALQMASDHPLGVGPGNYPLVFPAYRPAFVKVGLVESHTAYLTVLVEMGVLGLVAFLWVMAVAVWRTLGAVSRHPGGTIQAVAVGALAASATLLVQSMTYSLEASKFLWLTLGLGLAVAGMSSESKGTK